MSKFMNVGGQAVIEGVMMKSPNFVAVAVRKSNKTITIKEMPYNSLTNKYSFLKWPFLRGIVLLFEMLILGLKSLTFAANEVFDEDEEQLSNWGIAFTLIISLVFSVGLFLVVPYAITYLLGFNEETNSIMFNAIDGMIKLGLFITYVVLISLMTDIKRVFQYHGAEHKAVNCYESGKKLTVANAQKFTTINARCGTSFVLFVMLIGIFVFSIVPLLVMNSYPAFAELNFWLQRAILLVTRLLFLLPLASISYEVLKLSAKYSTNPLFKIIMQPGLLVQQLTTRQPTDDQVKVALESMKYVLKKEQLLAIR